MRKSPDHEPKLIRYDLQLALADGLFPSVKPAINGSTTTTRKITLPHYHIEAPDKLNSNMESVLLGILYLLGHSRQQEIISQTETLATLETTQYQLLKVCGMGHASKEYGLLRRHLQLLSLVTLYPKEEHCELLNRKALLSYRLNGHQLIINLHNMLIDAMCGNRLHAYIDLAERVSLKRDADQIAHRWLSAYVWPGKTRVITYSRLAQHIWPTFAHAASSTQRTYLHRIRTQVIPAISALAAWRLVVSKKQVTVVRKSYPTRLIPEPIPDSKPIDAQLAPTETFFDNGNKSIDEQRCLTLEEHRAWFKSAFQKANNELWIVSPFVSHRALAADGVYDMVRMVVERKVRVVIMVDSIWVYDNAFHYRARVLDAIKNLVSVGAEVYGVPNVHAKIVMIDNLVLAEGSFNWLSAERTRTNYTRFDTTQITTGEAVEVAIQKTKTMLAEGVVDKFASYSSV